MTHQIALMLGLTALLIGLLLWGRLRTDIIALFILALLAVTHIITPHAILSGFASQAVIAIIAVMIIGAAIDQTGLLNSLSQKLIRLCRYRSGRIIFGLSTVTAILAGILRSIGGFTLMMPAMNRISMTLKIPKSKLFMPVGFAAISGGVLTLIGSGPLLVLNDIFSHFRHNPEFHHTNLSPLGLFTVTPIGLSIVIAIMIFFALFGRWLLPNITKGRMHFGADTKHFNRAYGYAGQYFELSIPKDSDIHQLSLHELEALLGGYEIAVVALSTGKEIFMPPLRKIQFSPQTHIAVVGQDIEITAFAKQHNLKASKHLKQFDDALSPVRSGFSEVLIPPGSSLIGTHMRELHMRRNFGVQVLSVHRHNKMITGHDMRELNIRSGDTLGLFSTWRSLAKLDKKPEFAVITTDYPKTKKTHSHHKWLALFWLLLSLVLIGVFNFKPAVGLLIGAAGVLVTKVIEPDHAYRAISWKTVFLLAGLIPYGIAMQKTGTAHYLAHFELHFIQSHMVPAWIVLTGIAIVTALFSLIMSNVGAAVVMIPIAMQFALAIHADPRLFAIVTAISTSNAFLLPTHQVSTIVSSSAGYTTKHYLIIGGLVSLLYLIVMMVTSSWLLH